MFATGFRITRMEKGLIASGLAGLGVSQGASAQNQENEKFAQAREFKTEKSYSTDLSQNSTLNSLMDQSLNVNSFAHDFSDGYTFKTTVFSQPEWLTENNTQIFHSNKLEYKTQVLSCQSQAENHQGFSSINFSDLTKNFSVAPANAPIFVTGGSSGIGEALCR